MRYGKVQVFLRRSQKFDKISQDPADLKLEKVRKASSAIFVFSNALQFLGVAFFLTVNLARE